MFSKSLFSKHYHIRFLGQSYWIPTTKPLIKFGNSYSQHTGTTARRHHWTTTPKRCLFRAPSRLFRRSPRTTRRPKIRSSPCGSSAGSVPKTLTQRLFRPDTTRHGSFFKSPVRAGFNLIPPTNTPKYKYENIEHVFIRYNQHSCYFKWQSTVKSGAPSQFRTDGTLLEKSFDVCSQKHRKKRNTFDL